MIQQPHSHHNTQEQQSQNWQQKYKELCEKLTNLQHEQKKNINQIRNDLLFERKRANEFEQKYKNAIRYKNQEQELKKILNQLNQKLSNKENQILQYMKSDQEKKRKIGELNGQIQQLTQKNQQINQELAQIKQGAISAILEKDSIISNLQQKLIQFQNIDYHQLQSVIVQLQEKYRQLEDKSEAQKRQIQGIVQMKDQQIRDIRDKIDVQRQRYEQKIVFLEQEIISFEKHIQKINQQRTNQQNLQEKYYILQEKQRKTQKKLQEFQNIYKVQKQDYIDAIQKLQGEVASKNDLAQQIKLNQNKIRQLQKDIKSKSKQIQDGKHTIQKTKSDYMKKIIELEQDKKKIQDNLDLKNNQIQRMKTQHQQNKNSIKTPEKKTNKADKDGSSLSNQLDSAPTMKSSLRRQSSQQSSAIIEKLKNQIKDLNENIQQLNKKLEQQTKQVQSLRQKLVEKSGSGSRTDGQTQLLVQIQDLNSHIKKVQHILMNTRYKYAEDENYWKSKQTELKKQLQKLDRKSKKQKAELLQRIDRMKKTNVKDKKTDYYQSSLK